MPLVFVHGVSVRDESGYKEKVAVRDAFFRRLLLDGIVSSPWDATILNPYWGRFGARFAWDYASLPGQGVESLGVDEELSDQLMDRIDALGGINPDAVVLEVARRFSLEESLDVLWAAALDQLEGTKAGDLAALSAAAGAYARANPSPAWLGTVSTDQQFLAELAQHIRDEKSPSGSSVDVAVPAVEILGSPGVWDRLSEGAGRLRDAFRLATGRAFVGLKRARLNHDAGLFLGDVFVYLKDPRRISGEVAHALLTANRRLCPTDDKLIIVAHSMGGNIVYDILSSVLCDLPVDVVVTVGSQVAFFEELKLFAVSDPQLPNERVRRVAKPQNVRVWLNVFDPSDVLGFAAEGVFEGVTDFVYSTGKGVLASHSAYFIRPSFYARLTQRLRELIQ